MANVNKHGLSRTIPADVKRKVRENSGFGCVVCGNAIYEYEHVEPEFIDAKEHDPACITLLCPQHHTKVTNGRLSKDQIKEHMADPKAKQQGFSNEMFDIGKGDFYFWFGGSIFKKVKIPLRIGATNLIEFKAPEVPAGPIRISALFTDTSGKITVRIVDNEWFAFTSNWDVEVVGNTLKVWEASRAPSLELVFYPPDTISIPRLRMRYGGKEITADKDKLNVDGMEFKNCSFENFAAAFVF